jgi:hypothetical protein
MVPSRRLAWEGNQQKQKQKDTPHGVSTTTKPVPGRSCAAAQCADVERVFKVHKTGSDPHHYTVELPDPVTQEVADMFNQLFRQVVP